MITEPNIRLMTLDDISAVAIIERRSYTHPWSAELLSDCVRVGLDCWVIEVLSEIKGFAIVGGQGEDSHLMNICISPGSRRQAYGETLLAFLLDHSHEKAKASVFLEVKPTNLAAIKLYQKYGFSQEAIVENYYQEGERPEDALVFRKRLSP